MTRCNFPVYLHRDTRKILDLVFVNRDAFLSTELPRARLQY